METLEADGTTEAAREGGCWVAAGRGVELRSRDRAEVEACCSVRLGGAGDGVGVLDAAVALARVDDRVPDGPAKRRSASVSITI